MIVRILLIAVFIVAIAIRFLYFPDNIYFGFDQARDAYTSQQVARGDLKVVGPPTAIEGINHGPLYYYIFGPIYLISQGDPAGISAFLRIYNALGIFLTFLIAAVIFNRYVGLISALIFAFSFEQTQYSIYLNHPSLAVNSVLLFYLGLAILIFKRKVYGLLISVFGLALSIQFEFPLIYLIVIFFITLFLFKDKLSGVRIKEVLGSTAILLITLSSFILSEYKFNFRVTHTLLTKVILNHSINTPNYLKNITTISQRFLNDNLLNITNLWGVVYLLLFIAAIIAYRKNKLLKNPFLFLLTWFLGGLIPYINNTSHLPLYYYGIGASVSLIIYSSFLVQLIWKKFKILAILLIAVVIVSNLKLITTQNPNGSIPTINVQSGMILGDQKKALDYMYQEAEGKPFSVNALGMPLYINTVWSYLFEWYGSKTYGYLPVWGGELAKGYPGGMPYSSSRSSLPNKKFLIIEPSRGIEARIIKEFLANEDIFTSVLKTHQIGMFEIQTRVNDIKNLSN